MAKLAWAPKIRFGKFYLTANVASSHPLYWGVINGTTRERVPSKGWVLNPDVAIFFDSREEAESVRDRIEKEHGPEINVNQVPTEAQWRKQQGA